ncbi:MAG TPA: M23 family metallopeptidase [Nevskiaceae bacterium]|nr:M23 family metallopeptidase [Nevskiaceae bacterium]
MYRVGTLLALLAGVWAGVAGAAELGDGVSLRGAWRQGAVLMGHAPAGTQVSFDGHTLDLTSYGTFVIGLDRDEKSPAVVGFAVPGHASHTWSHAVANGHWRIQRINGMNKSQTQFAPQVLARIEREAAEIRKVRAVQTTGIGFTQHFIWPVVGRISSVFGSQRILDGVPRQPHYGVDIAVPTGTPVRAPAEGVVSLVAPDLYFTGKTLMIDHGHGVQSVFAHLSHIDVKFGEHVKQGQVVALTGATGRATGPNLHWGVSWFESRVNAAALAGPMPQRH